MTEDIEQTQPIQNYLTPEQRLEAGRIGNLNGNWSRLLKFYLTAGLPFMGWLVLGHFGNREQIQAERGSRQVLEAKFEDSRRVFEDKILANATEIRAREDIYRVAANLAAEISIIKRDQEQLRGDIFNFKSLMEANGKKMDRILTGMDGE